MGVLGLLGVGGSSFFVQSVQEVEITFSAGSTTGTGTITSVDTTRSIVLLNGWRSATNTDLTQLLCHLQLTNATTVTATRNTGTNASIVRATVIQFKASAVSSVQQGTISLGTTTSATATITSVDTARSVAVFLGALENHTAASDRAFCAITLTDATTVTANRQDAFTNTATVGYVVIEFASGVVSSVEKVSITIAAGATSNTATITSVDTARSVLFFGGNTLPDAQNAEISCTRVALTNSTTVTANRNTLHATTTCTIKCTVVQFAAGRIASIQRGTSTISASSGSTDTTINKVTTSRAWANYLGFTTTSTSIFDENDVFPTLSLLSSTSLRIQRGNTSGSPTITVSYEIVEFR